MIDGGNDLEMTFWQKESFSKALDYSQKASALTRQIREGTPFDDRERMLKIFSIIWSNYEELFLIMRRLVGESHGELRRFFGSCYEGYLIEYRILREDMGELLLMNQVNKKINLPEYTQSLSELLSNLHSAEMQPISGKSFMKGIAFRTIDLLSFLMKVFSSAESGDKYSFFLSPRIRITENVMTIVDKSNIKLWNADALEYNKLSTELNNIENRLRMLIRQNPGNFGVLEFVLRECAEKLSVFCTSTTGRSILDKTKKKVIETSNFEDDESTVVEFFNTVVSSNEPVFIQFNENSYLKALSSVIKNSLQLAELLNTSLDNFGIDSKAVEIGFILAFIKRFALRVILSEMYKRLVLYNKTKSKNLLN